MKSLSTCSLLLLIALLCSCAATGASHSSIVDRIPPIPDGMARITFYRLHISFEGSAGSPDVIVDGEKLGELPSGGFFFVDVTPGHHSIVLERSFVQQGFQGPLEIGFDTPAGSNSHVKYHNALGELRVADSFQAQLDIGSCVYTGADSALRPEAP